MAHNLDFSTGRAGFAFTGDRDDIWHRLGTEMAEGQSIEQWAAAAGLDWRAVHCEAVANLRGEAFDRVDAGRRFQAVPGFVFVARNDTGHVLGWGTPRRQEVQPIETLRFLDQYCSVNPLFKMSAAGSLLQGEKVWATALYSDMTVAGDKLKAYLLATTSYDGSMATVLKGTTVRSICNNTLDAALGEKGGEVRVRHNTTFDPQRAARELEVICQSFSRFKQMGDAMAQTKMAGDQVSRFFMDLLSIPYDTETGRAKKDEVSTRKANQFADLREAYEETSKETDPWSVWCALNAVTRYVDHERSTRTTNGTSPDEAQFASSQFGSGAAMKQEAMALLMPRIKDRVPVLA